MSSPTEEHRPLLRSQSQPLDQPDEPKRGRHLLSVFTILKSFLTNNPTLVGTFCLQFCNYLAKHMVEVPMIKLFEQALCDRYYISSQVVPERDCKIPPIQDALAALTGLKFAFDALPGLLTALYYGFIADKFGRRIVLALCAAGNIGALLWILFVCYSGIGLPVRLVWASSAFLCIGGSQRVAKGMGFTLVADSTEVPHR